jgi:hypothetical protein
MPVEAPKMTVTSYMRDVVAAQAVDDSLFSTLMLESFYSN